MIFTNGARGTEVRPGADTTTGFKLSSDANVTHPVRRAEHAGISYHLRLDDFGDLAVAANTSWLRAFGVLLPGLTKPNSTHMEATGEKSRAAKPSAYLIMEVTSPSFCGCCQTAPAVEQWGSLVARGLHSSRHPSFRCSPSARSPPRWADWVGARAVDGPRPVGARQGEDRCGGEADGRGGRSRGGEGDHRDPVVLAQG